MNFKRIYLQSTVSKAFLDIDYFLMCFELRRSTWIGKYTNNDFVYSTFLNCIYDTLTLSCVLYAFVAFWDYHRLCYCLCPWLWTCKCICLCHIVTVYDFIVHILVIVFDIVSVVVSPRVVRSRRRRSSGSCRTCRERSSPLVSTTISPEIQNNMFDLNSILSGCVF